MFVQRGLEYCSSDFEVLLDLGNDDVNGVLLLSHLRITSLTYFDFLDN